MRREVFHARGKDDAVTIEASLEDGRARVRVIPPNGSTVERMIPLRPVSEADGAVRVSGSLDISLGAIGSDAVKGPMNAFRVKDRVEVIFALIFQ